MSVTSGFFNSLNGDRKYNAQQMSALFDGLINDGVFATIGTAFEVLATTGMAFSVGIGRAWFNHVWVYNDAILPMSLSDSEMILERIDAVVIEINNEESVRAGQILVVQGTPASQATRPTLTNTEAVHQYPLAYIHVRAGAESITQADITNMVGSDPCPYVTGLLEVRDIENIVSQWEAQFVQWMDGLGDILEGDVAANMANRILELESQFKDLARDKSLYDTIEDDDGYAIKDSNGFEIEGRISFAGNFASEGSGSGSEEEEPDVPSYTGDGFQVGDILTTVRRDLGPKWLLCNGQSVERDQYPTLADIYGFNPVGGWTMDTIDPEFVNYQNKTWAWNFTRYFSVAKVAYINGKYIALGTFGNELHVYVFIAYTDDITSGEWTTKTIHTFDSSYSTTDDNPLVVRAIDITYGNGIYAVLIMDGESSDNGDADFGPAVLYSTSLDAATWTRTALGTGSTYGYNGGMSLSYINGYFVFTPTCSGSIRFRYTNDIASADWNTETLTSQNTIHAMYIPNMLFVDGKYVLVSYQVYGVNYGDETLRCFSTTTIDGTWTNIVVDTVDFNADPSNRPHNYRSGHQMSDLAYLNGNFIFGFYNLMDHKVYIYHTSDPDSTSWTKILVDDKTPSEYYYLGDNVNYWYEMNIKMGSIVYIDGLYMMTATYAKVSESGLIDDFDYGDTYLYYSPNLTGPWMKMLIGPCKLSEDSYMTAMRGNYPMNHLQEVNGYLTISTLYHDKTRDAVQPVLYYKNTEAINLPNISFGNAYSYIKVEE